MASVQKSLWSSTLRSKGSTACFLLVTQTYPGRGTLSADTASTIGVSARRCIPEGRPSFRQTMQPPGLHKAFHRSTSSVQRRPLSLAARVISCRMLCLPWLVARNHAAHGTWRESMPQPTLGARGPYASKTRGPGLGPVVPPATKTKTPRVLGRLPRMLLCLLSAVYFGDLLRSRVSPDRAYRATSFRARRP